MKHVYVLFLLCALTLSGFAQTTATVSGGLLGAVNFTSFRLGDDNVFDEDFTHELGFSAGAYVNIPLGRVFSVEPQVLFSIYDYEDADRPALLPSGSLNYITIPINLKIHVHEAFAFTVGPQFDLLIDLDRAPFDITEDDFTSTSLSLGLGVELFPYSPLSLFGRYVHGFTDLDNRENSADEYFNSNFQFGFKLRLFGNAEPVDTDADGIPDRDDDCPTVAGIALFAGCPDTDNDGFQDSADECPTIAGVAKYNGCPIPDTDGDGINDENDKCPSVAGVSKYDGCPIPDTDGDGVNDEMDKCPSIAGVAKYDGCPIPDTDGDGINDEKDKCPTVAGLAQFDGCPNPDRDMDGVPDATDLCPDVKGPASNDGCPVVESATFNARMIQFVTGSAELTAQAKRNLREGANLLKSGDFANLKISIEGHTDNVGSKESNHTLSHRRADSVKAELVKNGINADRITTAGYGEDRPIATNDTAEGRAQNRRVEIKARQ